jgi:hypothetical protein
MTIPVDVEQLAKEFKEQTTPRFWLYEVIGKSAEDLSLSNWFVRRWAPGDSHWRDEAYIAAVTAGDALDRALILDHWN